MTAVASRLIRTACTEGIGRFRSPARLPKPEAAAQIRFGHKRQRGSVVEDPVDRPLLKLDADLLIVDLHTRQRPAHSSQLTWQLLSPRSLFPAVSCRTLRGRLKRTAHTSNLRSKKLV